MQQYIESRIKEIENSLEKEYYVSINIRACADYFVKASSKEEARKKAQFEFETQEIHFPNNWEITDSDKENDFYVEDLTERKKHHNPDTKAIVRNYPVTEAWEV